MSFLISDAVAQTAAAATPGGDIMQLFPILLLAVFYFLLIRPQQKRAKEHKEMLEALKKGDEVTVSGLIGRVVEIGENFVLVEFADNLQVKVQRQAVASLMPKGTYKGSL